MAVTVYGAALSPYVARVMLACDFKGVPYGLTMPKDGIKGPDYLKLNPFGKIPTIKDGKDVVYESSVIVDYLDAKYRKKKLVPASAKAGASARLIGTIAAEYVQPHGLAIFRVIRAKSNDQAAIDAAKAELAKGLDVLEGLMTGKKFAAGRSPTIADCYVIPALFFATEVGALVGETDALGPRGKLKAYWAGVRKNKSVAKLVEAMSNRLKQILAGG
jgi:glutathione S-transferase